MSTLIQAATGAAFNGTTVKATLTSVTAGHNIRAALLFYPNTLTFVSIGDGTNTYAVGASSDTSHTSVLCTAFNPDTRGGNIIVTATVSGGMIGAAYLLIEEWSGDATRDQPDGTPVATFRLGDKGINLQAGSITTTVDGDDVWCVLFQPQNAVPTAGAGFSIGSNGLNSNFIFTEHQVQSAHGEINANWTAGPGSFDNYLGAIAFKPLATKSSASGCKGALAIIGLGCGIWAAEKFQENAVFTRRRLLLPGKRAAVVPK
jgi:hypothetical protein